VVVVGICIVFIAMAASMFGAFDHGAARSR
jgi:thiol:disulfide interchange protein